MLSVCFFLLIYVIRGLSLQMSSVCFCFLVYVIRAVSLRMFSVYFLFSIWLFGVTSQLQQSCQFRKSVRQTLDIMQKTESHIKKEKDAKTYWYGIRISKQKQRRKLRNTYKVDTQKKADISRDRYRNIEENT